MWAKWAGRLITSNPCRVCANPAWSDQVGHWVGEGLADREIGRRLGVSKSLVSRHRQRHILVPMQHQAAVVAKGAGAQRERQQLARAAACDAPTPAQVTAAFLGLDAIASDISRIAQRLDASAGEAAAAGQHGGHAALAGQLLRQAELRARLGGHDRPAPTKGEGAVFSVQIVFSGGRVEHIAATPDSGRRTIDLEPASETDDT
jgi:hypothetical protein